MTGEYATDAAALKTGAEKLNDLLKIRTLPIGMKLLESAADMDSIKGLRRPKEGRHHTTCQLVTQSRITGFTLGITAENLRPASNCGGIIGIDTPEDAMLSGERMDGVWFENREAACAHQTHMPRVPGGKYEALVISPLRGGRIDRPDIILFYGTPGQMILFVNGLQWKRYKRYDFTITGESACADSWGRALKTGETSLSLPCFAERRYGGVSDEELAMAVPPDEFVRAIEGLEGLSKAGLRYPVPPYGPQADPAEGMSASYS